LPARPFERIVDGERQVGMPFIRVCGAIDIDFPAVRKRQADVDLVEATCAVMTTGRFSAPPGQPSACRNAAQGQQCAWRGRPEFAASLACLDIRFRSASA